MNVIEYFFKNGSFPAIIEDTGTERAGLVSEREREVWMRAIERAGAETRARRLRDMRHVM